jgi:hypothetical protein
VARVRAVAGHFPQYEEVLEELARHDGPMAGFDFEFTYRERDKEVVLACLQAARRRARRLGPLWRWNHVQPWHLRVVVDGNSRRTDLLGYRLERDLPLVAEGCSGSASPAERARLGRGLADMFLRGRHVESDDDLGRRVERRQAGEMVLRGVAETRYYYPPYELECPAFPKLHARLRITEEVLVAWNFQEVAPEVLLEELHTACELLLEETVNRRSKRLSFAELIARADNAGVFAPLRVPPEVLRVVGWDGMPSVELLTQLKDLRKDVRHRAVSGSLEWLTEHWEEVALLLERSVSGLNRWGPPTPDGPRWWTWTGEDLPSGRGE